MLTVGLIVIFLTLWLAYRKRCISVLKDQGIPGPEPNVLFGNLLEIVTKNPLVCHKEWFKKYGKVVGYYFGMQPVVLVSDVELIKKIQVSDFHKFINRPNLFGGGPERKDKPVKRTEGFSQQLIALRDQKWKDIRSIITPSFTASKMKHMVPIMDGAIDSLLANIEKKKGQSMDIYSMFQGLTMDVIGRTAFGIHADAQNDPEDPFLKFTRMLFSGISIRNPISFLAICFRSFHLFWSYLGRLIVKYKYKGISPVGELILSVKGVIATRRANKENRRPDLLQLMMDSEIDDSKVTSDDLTADADNTTEKAAGSTTGKLLRKMTDADILDNSLLFFLAGYETTSTALAFTAHFLIKYPDIQEKIRIEIQQICESEDTLDYQSVSKLQYLEQVLNESMRLYPPVPLFVSRGCSEDVKIGDVHFKKGTDVQVAVYQIHRDPELWGSDAEEFNPERFSPQNKSKLHPMAFQAFGQGPRNCVGMRFAYLEAKLALARLLSKYRLVACAETEKDISLHITFSSMKPKKGVWVKVEAID
ncbi:hypothetical protein JTE90_029048 [Oedothorax gibbosus]|uniref:Cytochrome P450 n=1 Tax=Oedothorax gibbosus TaxID=931172 RepID=A0AAV6UX93_9ARAC|nr:hypothetical protein JTE90_029048 [Oedothorax gibbosus]